MEKKMVTHDEKPLFLGHGTEKYAKGGSFTGYFENNLKNGQGRLLNPDGSYYDGRWVDGKKEGDYDKNNCLPFRIWN